MHLAEGQCREIRRRPRLELQILEALQQDAGRGHRRVARDGVERARPILRNGRMLRRLAEQGQLYEES